MDQSKALKDLADQVLGLQNQICQYLVDHVGMVLNSLSTSQRVWLWPLGCLSRKNKEMTKMGNPH
jgi:hypothetical protein